MYSPWSYLSLFSHWIYIFAFMNILIEYIYLSLWIFPLNIYIFAFMNSPIEYIYLSLWIFPLNIYICVYEYSHWIYLYIWVYEYSHWIYICIFEFMNIPIEYIYIYLNWLRDYNPLLHTVSGEGLQEGRPQVGWDSCTGEAWAVESNMELRTKHSRLILNTVERSLNKILIYNL